MPGSVHDEAIPINSDHVTLVKYSKASDEGFQKVSDHILLMCEDAREKGRGACAKEQAIKST
jgi:hypothetical protein